MVWKKVNIFLIFFLVTKKMHYNCLLKILYTVEKMSWVEKGVASKTIIEKRKGPQIQKLGLFFHSVRPKLAFCYVA